MFVSCHDMVRLISCAVRHSSWFIRLSSVVLAVSAGATWQSCCYCNVSVMMSSERECQFAVQTFVLQYVHTRTIIITKARCQPQARPLLKETRPVLRSEA